MEARLLPAIDAAERRVLPRFVSPLVTKVAGSDARERWKRLPISARREVISTLMTVRIMLSTRDPGRSARSPCRSTGNIDRGFDARLSRFVQVGAAHLSTITALSRVSPAFGDRVAGDRGRRWSGCCGSSATLSAALRRQFLSGDTQHWVGA